MAANNAKRASRSASPALYPPSDRRGGPYHLNLDAHVYVAATSLPVELLERVKALGRPRLVGKHHQREDVIGEGQAGETAKAAARPLSSGPRGRRLDFSTLRRGDVSTRSAPSRRIRSHFSMCWRCERRVREPDTVVPRARQVVYVTSSGFTDYAPCFLGAASARCSCVSYSRLSMVM